MQKVLKMISKLAIKFRDTQYSKEQMESNWLRNCPANENTLALLVENYKTFLSNPDRVTHKNLRLSRRYNFDDIAFQEEAFIKSKKL
jgi:hypothetical protein